MDGLSVSQVKAEYNTALSDLTMNSKTIINVLTMLAADYIAFANAIVDCICTRIEESPANSLHFLYLIDSILKNIGGVYIQEFGEKIVHYFLDIYDAGDEKVRQSARRVRDTWTPIFSSTALARIDTYVARLSGSTQQVDNRQYASVSSTSQQIPSRQDTHFRPDMTSQTRAPLPAPRQASALETLQLAEKELQGNNIPNERRKELGELVIALKRELGIKATKAVAPLRTDVIRARPPQVAAVVTSQSIDPRGSPTHISLSQQYQRDLAPNSRNTPPPDPRRGHARNTPPPDIGFIEGRGSQYYSADNRNYPSSYSDGRYPDRQQQHHPPPGHPHHDWPRDRMQGPDPRAYIERDRYYMEGRRPLNGYIDDQQLRYPESRLTYPVHSASSLPYSDARQGYMTPPPLPSSSSSSLPSTHVEGGYPNQRNVEAFQQQPIIDQYDNRTNIIRPPPSLIDTSNVEGVGNNSAINNNIVHNASSSSLTAQSIALLNRLKGALPKLPLLGTPPLANSSPASPPVIRSTTRFDFNPESLKVFNAEALCGILDKSRTQCNNCGMRFPLHMKKELDDHYDWHFRLKTREEHIKMRGWYLSENEWLSCLERVVTLSLTETKTDTQQQTAKETAVSEVQYDNDVVACTEQAGKERCGLCKEEVTASWIDEEEGWFYKAAIRDGPLYHSRCYHEMLSTRNGGGMKRQASDDIGDGSGSSFSTSALQTDITTTSTSTSNVVKRLKTEEE